MTALEVGLVGAGPWAQLVHGPVLAAGPETRLAGVWARRPEAASELAGRLGVRPFARYEDLVDASEALAFAVPPVVQAELAGAAARREGRCCWRRRLPTTSTVRGAASGVSSSAFATMRHEFAEAVNTSVGHRLDVQRGLHLQQIIAWAEADLAART